MPVNIEKYNEINEFLNKRPYSKELPSPNLIAVTKTHSNSSINEAIKIGIRHFGENRVQEAYEKYFNLLSIHKDIILHMIGPLQTNKVKKALSIFNFFHSLDREKLAVEFSKYPKLLIKKYFFIQINTGSENQKSGIYPNLANDFINYCKNDLKLNIIGLMCIPPFNQESKSHFIMLKNLADENNLKHLSMGMSKDYKEAVEAGSTFIRIGSNLFGNRK